jgi:hypothetical protein
VDGVVWSADERPRGTRLSVKSYFKRRRTREINMPILLFTGIPVLLVGGGYIIYKVIGA